MAATTIKAYSGNDPYIFVSYAHKDRDRVYPFVEVLQQKYNVWFDEGLHYGREFDEEIIDKLGKCAVFVFMITDNSLKSINCKDELDAARKRSLPFINIAMDPDIIYPEWFEFRYDRFQRCNLFSFNTYAEAVDSLSEKSADCAKALIRKEDQTEQSFTDHNESEQQMFEHAITAFETGDFSKAVEYFRKAADQGHAEAQYRLGRCCEQGLGVEIDLTKAVEYYKKAAERGNSWAQGHLGRCYCVGLGVKKDLTKAVEYFRQSAEQGNFRAQFSLGWCYEEGLGVKKDYKKALEYYKKAADQSLDIAQYRLARCYEEGLGVKKDLSKAVEYYTKAAEQGYADAQARLDYINKPLIKRFFG